jgi:phosphopantothenoylcysteine decarboxylase/phosphopantothenate--cysteine ligase
MDPANAASDPAPARRVVLAVCGSIAAYKAADLCSKLVQAGHDVRVVMTHAATKLVGPLTFEALTGHRVALDPYASPEGTHVEHIDLADTAEAFVVAPATANFLAKAAAGIADDILTSTLLAVRCPVLVAPAMNVNMWEHPATQRNLETVRGFGYAIVAPGEGFLACGYTGAGRMAEPAHVAERVAEALAATG